MNGLSICKDLYEKILKGNVKGNIHSVFDNSFIVLDQDNQLITFLNPGKPMSPNSIKLNENASFSSLGIKPKLEVHFSKQFALIKGLDIVFSYKNAFIWNKEPDFAFIKDSKGNLFTKLELMGRVLNEHGNRDGILPLLNALHEKMQGLNMCRLESSGISKKDEFIKHRFLNFINSYICEDVCSIPSDAKSIIGYGKGLTPSMDDFLSGIMISRVYIYSCLGFSMDSIYRINKAIIKDIKGMTTLVSEGMLSYASSGETNEDIRQLMVSFLGSYPVEQFIKNMKKVIKIGQTSGTDILSGIYTGSIILLSGPIREGCNERSKV